MALDAAHRLERAPEPACLQPMELDAALRLERAPEPACLQPMALDAALRLERAHSRVNPDKPYMRLVQG